MNRESEIQNNVMFWSKRNIKLEVDEARSAIDLLPEVDGFDYYIVMPKGVSTDAIWKMLGKEIETDGSLYDHNLETFYAIPRDNTKKTYAIAMRKWNEAEGFCPRFKKFSTDTPLSFETNTGCHYMTFTEYLVAAMRWHEETGEFLDEEGTTFFPRNRTNSGHVPTIRYWTKYNRISVDSIGAQYEYNMGVRQVIAAGDVDVTPIDYNSQAPFCL